MSAGKVEIGCFRVFPDNYVEKKKQSEGGGSGGHIPQDKLKDFGQHADRYYQLEHSFFKSKFDSHILEILWNEYWIQTLSSSPLLNNAEYLTKAISNIAVKSELLVKSSGAAGGRAHNKGQKRNEDGGISGEKIEQLEKESCKCALEMNHGLMVEALKNFMFTTKPIHS